jgi:hypothetical protein
MSERKSRLAVPPGNDYPSAPSSSSRGAIPRSSSTAAYLVRLTDVRQMDIQAALDQMKTLLSTRPQSVYKTAYYRKQTKNHWARDDPAFCALTACFLLVACIAYSVAFRAPISTALAFSFYSIIVNWLVCGIIVATVTREIANRHLTAQQSSTHVRQTVEWWYAFDIHCNAFFPLFCLLWGVQFFLLPLVLGKSFLALIVSNTLYAAALSYYWYITHLGYRGTFLLNIYSLLVFKLVEISRNRLSFVPQLCPFYRIPKSIYFPLRPFSSSMHSI